VRDVPFPSQYTLNSWLPDATSLSTKVKISEFTRTNRAAKFRAYDAETPIGERDTFTVKEVGMPPLGQKLVIGEWEALMINQLTTGGNNNSAIIKAIYDDAAINARAVHTRMELLRGQCLDTGKNTIRENGLNIEAVWGVPGGNFVNPAGDDWDVAATADPIADLRLWSDAYEALNGERPSYALTSRSVIAALLLCTTVRNYFINVVGTAPTLITRSQLNQVFEAHDLPQFVPYSAKANVDGSDVDVMNPNLVRLLPATPIGSTQWGITAEALELAGGTNPRLAFSETPGLVGVVMKDGDPVRTWTKVGAIGMPMIHEPNKLMICQVTT
jgi:hypothetical protein